MSPKEEGEDILDHEVEVNMNDYGVGNKKPEIEQIVETFRTTQTIELSRPD